MSQDRLYQIRGGFADDTCQGDEPPDLGPLRVLAEGEELAEAVSRLADSCGRPLPADDSLYPLARDVACALTEAGFTLHHCAQHYFLSGSSPRCSASPPAAGPATGWLRPPGRCAGAGRRPVGRAACQPASAPRSYTP